MIKGKETLKSFTIATVTEVKEGMVSAKTVTGALTVALKAFTNKENWGWAAKPFLDGRYMVACPTAEAARELEKGGVLHLPKFSLRFEPWTADLWETEKADGERRWVTIYHLPIFCWDRDSMALLLKPIGDLVYVNEQGAIAMEQIRAVVRIRRGQLLPAMIKASIDHRKYTFTVDLERGEAPLPWSEDPGLRPSIPLPPQVVIQAPARAPWPKPKTHGEGQKTSHADKGKGKEIMVEMAQQLEKQKNRDMTETVAGDGLQCPETRGRRILLRDRSVASDPGELHHGPVHLTLQERSTRAPLAVASGSKRAEEQRDADLYVSTKDAG
ncbi:hypothetical protein J5N97_022509 [Dioscorea zingiberensis]|uniref:DUF4283 domain-containing protein n=1 Tax=Dioscorea zingiberensis TaxID=325984 RepID=A0A9D5HAW8_9LILI|nr:hypothetical protein J5N97_022509 [Dioscorea zingiberensis]